MVAMVIVSEVLVATTINYKQEIYSFFWDRKKGLHCLRKIRARTGTITDCLQEAYWKQDWTATFGSVV